MVSKPEALDDDCSTARIMVVDDDMSMRLLVTTALENCGFKVIEAENGEIALDKYQSEKPDVVLLDVMMPLMDGYTTCSRLRHLPGSEHVPVLMMTGLDDEESIDRAYDAGATDFITKPINYALLGHRVRYMLRASETTNELVRSEYKLANAQRIAHLGHWEWNADTDSLTWSEEIYSILDIGKTAISLKCFDDFVAWVPLKQRDLVTEWYKNLIDGHGFTSLNHRIQRVDGSERHIRQQTEAVYDAEGKITHLSGIFQDITEIREAEEKIQRLAYFDSLTNLPNREFFKRRVKEALAIAKRHNKKGALLFLDLDNFKRINDTLGHNIGDMLLKAAAKRLIESVRTSDVVSRPESGDMSEDIARMGGDEFTLLVSDMRNEEDAAAVALRILETFTKPFHLSGHEVVVSPSIGISVFPDDGDEVGRLLRNGDLAMYHAKRAGKNAFNFYNEKMNEVATQRLIMENHLRKALLNNEMEIYYQPQKDVVTGNISGIEALLRWNNPSLGSVPPDLFIPLAEETGLIVEIGEWVLRTACSQAKHWRENGIALPRVAVNVSVHQFVQTGFANQIATILNDTGLDAHVLELEVTEGLLMKDAVSAVKTLTQLKEIGVQLAIDDFGTGYSSLSYLKQFPIDRLKIDKQFVRDVNTDPSDAAITMAVIAMAEKMALKVTAEGVETDEQMSFLESRNCDEIQGYHLSRPVSSEKIEYFLSHWSENIRHPSEILPAILLVDDDPSTLSAHSNILNQEGYLTLTAINPEEGFKILAKHSVGVVISDYQMSGMNGNEFLRRIRNLYPMSIRIMISGASDKQSLIKSVNEGAIYKFLEKPVNLVEFRETVRNAFALYKQLPEKTKHKTGNPDANMESLPVQ